MSNRNLIRPFFPDAPAEYNRRYQQELTRAFSVFLEQFQNPGDARNTTLTLTNLPTTDQGLETGALFQVDGFLKITQAHTPHVVGVDCLVKVGTVQVKTT